MANMKPNEFAEKIGVSVKTLQRWDMDGVLKANRNPKGRRYYTDDQLKKYSLDDDSKTEINCYGAKIVSEVVKITNGSKSIHIEAGMTVCLFTDGTEFEEEFVDREVLSVDETEIRFEDANIPWEYIRSIYIVSR